MDDDTTPGRSRRWLPALLLAPLAWGVVLQIYLTVTGVLVVPGLRGEMSLPLRFAQVAAFPSLVETSPFMFMPALLLILLTSVRTSWAPVPGPRTGRTAAVLVGAVATWSLVQGVGFLWWLAAATDIERANLGIPTGAAFFIQNGFLVHVWSALVLGSLAWCLALARPPTAADPAPDDPAANPAADPGDDLDRFRRPS